MEKLGQVDGDRVIERKNIDLMCFEIGGQWSAEKRVVV